MNIFQLRIPLNATPEQFQRLASLQLAFAEVCNALAPMVRDTRCWNRVALHHMAYRNLRERFPGLGSQMVCNAIYSVSRTSRLLFQTPNSPLNIQRLGGKPLPLMRFLPSAPVYFDRHTLSIRHRTLSMFTLDGRMHFELKLADEDLLRFKELKLMEVVLSLQEHFYVLSFSFSPKESTEVTLMVEPAADTAWPNYLVLDEESEPLLNPASQLGAPVKRPHFSGVNS